MTTRRERLEAQRDRREDWAGSRDVKSADAFSTARTIANGIPLGQPILVGHHSERRARRDAERIGSNMAAGVEHMRAAYEHREKAAGLNRILETHVFSDDDDAVDRLRERIAAWEAERARVKAFNASCRKGAPDLSLLDEKQQADHATLVKHVPWQLGRGGGFPAYATGNLGQRIRQTEKRIEQIERERAAAEAGERAGGRAMLSKYGGSCDECGEPIEKGTPIVWYRSTREAVHATCPS